MPTPLRRGLRFAGKSVWYLFALVALLAALIVAAVTQGLDWLERHPERVSHWLSAQASHPVRFSGLQASWTRRGPLLRLDDLRIGLFAKPYAESVGEQRAYQIAVAAAGLRSIDGKPFVPTLFAEADLDALFDEKCQKVAKMYPHVVQRIYRAVLDAEKEFVSLVDRLGKSTG